MSNPDNWQGNGPETPEKRFLPDTFVTPEPHPDEDMWPLADNLVITKGSIVSGTLDSTHSANDIELVLGESAGSPGFSYDFWFGENEAVPTTDIRVDFEAYYDGNAGHNVNLQQYNWVTDAWTTVQAGAFPDAASEQNYGWHLIDNAAYLSSGRVRLRIIHTSPGNPNHELHIDHMYLSLDPP